MESPIDRILRELTLEEKAALVRPRSRFSSGSVERLGVAGLTISIGASSRDLRLSGTIDLS